MKMSVLTGLTCRLRALLNLGWLAMLWATVPVAFTAAVASTPPAQSSVRTSSYVYADGSVAGQPKGFLIKEVIEPNSAQDCLQTSYFYDTFGNRKSSSNAACAGAVAPATNSATVARTTTAGYDAAGRFPLTLTNALNHQETKEFNANFGTVKSLLGPNGLATVWEYDGFGRKTKETRADATYTTLDSKLCSETGANCPGPIGGASVTWVSIEKSFAANAAPNGPEKRQYFDALNRVLRIQTQGFDGTGAAPDLVQDTEYNALGQVLRQSNMYALVGGTPVWSRFTYDAIGRTLTETHTEKTGTTPVDAVTIYGYSGLSSTVTNANGQIKATLTNSLGQVVSVTDHLGSKVLYTYDPLGNLTQTDAAGSVTTMSYSVRGFKLSMQDPAMGSWTYGYNAFGELVTQRDSLNQSSTIDYDLLGRMVKRTEPDLLSEWSYDKRFDGSACGKGIGKLCEAKSNNNYNRKVTYDSLGRPSNTATTMDIPGVPASVTETYDSNTGRVASKTWPTGFVANYTYSSLGYLKGVSGSGNGAPQPVSYTVNKMNAKGQVTEYRTGNSVTTVSDYDLQTQRLNAIRATRDGQASGNVLNHSYTYDALGNLLTRADTSPAVGTQESFSYDGLNRLTTASILGGAVSPNTTQVMYDARGNITYKSDVGRYWYDAARPNRMTNVTLETAPGATVAFNGTRTLSYAFDDLKTGAQTVGTTTLGNGNLEYTVSHDAVNSRHTVRYESYTSFNMPSQFVYGNFITNTSSTADRTLSFVYGPEHQRTKQNINLTGNGTSAYFAGNVWYLNGEDSLGLSFEKEVRANGTIENKHFLSAGGSVFAVFTSRTGTLNGLPATTTSYMSQDHLSSASVITDGTGAVVERLAYDPWGKRRNIMTLPGTPDNLDALVGMKTDRGYSMHEHLDEVGIIHMNGRVFDPLIGRFMSADATIQAPYNLKSFNRYSYVWNNPLKYFDPSGYSTEWLNDADLMAVRINNSISNEWLSQYNNSSISVTANYGWGSGNSSSVAFGNSGVNNSTVIFGNSSNVGASIAPVNSNTSNFSNSPGYGSTTNNFTDPNYVGYASYVSQTNSNAVNSTSASTYSNVSNVNQSSGYTSPAVGGGVCTCDDGVSQFYNNRNDRQVMWPILAGIVLGAHEVASSEGPPLAPLAGLETAAARAGLEVANFAQKTYGAMFSKGGIFAGKSVNEVAEALSSGALDVAMVPIDFIVREGNTLILNTRSAKALELAGIPRSMWNSVNRTGQELYETMLSDQLRGNGLTSKGVATVRPSGGR